MDAAMCCSMFNPSTPLKNRGRKQQTVSNVVSYSLLNMKKKSKRCKENSSSPESIRRRLLKVEEFFALLFEFSICQYIFKEPRLFLAVGKNCTEFDGIATHREHVLRTKANFDCSF